MPDSDAGPRPVHEWIIWIDEQSDNPKMDEDLRAYLRACMGALPGEWEVTWGEFLRLWKEDRQLIIEHIRTGSQIVEHPILATIRDRVYTN